MGDALSVDNRARNTLISALRAPAERANALLKKHLAGATSGHPRPLADRRIGAIAAAALVQFQL